jgi:hypothetical protein
MYCTPSSYSTRDSDRASAGLKPWLCSALFAALLPSCTNQHAPSDLPNAATADDAGTSRKSTDEAAGSAGSSSVVAVPASDAGQGGKGAVDAAGGAAPSASAAGGNGGSPTPAGPSVVSAAGVGGGGSGGEGGSGGAGASGGAGPVASGGAGASGPAGSGASGASGVGGILPIGPTGLPASIAELAAGMLAPIPCTSDADCNDSQVHVLALVPICDASSATCVGCPTKAQHDAQASRIINCASAMVFAGCMTDACIQQCKSPCM